MIKKSFKYKRIQNRLHNITSHNLQSFFKIIDVPGDGLCGFYAFLTTSSKNNTRRTCILPPTPDRKQVLDLCSRLRTWLQADKYNSFETYEGQIKEMLERIDSNNIRSLELDVLHALSLMTGTTVCVYYNKWKGQEWIILNYDAYSFNKNIKYLRQTGNHYMAMLPLVDII